MLKYLFLVFCCCVSLTSCATGQAKLNILLENKETIMPESFGPIDVASFKKVKFEMGFFRDLRKDPTVIGQNIEWGTGIDAKLYIAQSTKTSFPSNYVSFWLNGYIEQILGRFEVDVVKTGGNAILEADIVKFYVIEQNLYEGTVILNWRLKSIGGSVLWEGTTTGSAQNKGRSFKEVNCQEVLSNATIGAVYNLLKTDAFIQAVNRLNAGAQAITTPINGSRFMPKAQNPNTTPAGMVYVKGGCIEREKVCLDDFYMDKTEVTQEAYQRVIGSNPSAFTECPTCPVEQVNWNEANVFCGKVGRRLPTEEEWQYAATNGGKEEIYAGTSDESRIGEYAWYENNSGGKTHPVGEKKPNGLGLYDMSGNVWEWTDGWEDGRMEKRVLRGGSWSVDAGHLRTTHRNDFNSPVVRRTAVGFRCSQ